MQPIRPGFTGVFTALVTPMRPQDGDENTALASDASPRIDERALAQLVEQQIEGGVSGLVACGTTGEAATMSAAEQERVIRIVSEAAARRVPVLAGIGSPSTAQSIELGGRRCASGCRVFLAVTPYHNRPPQEGLLQHFRAIAKLGRRSCCTTCRPAPAVTCCPTPWRGSASAARGGVAERSDRQRGSHRRHPAQGRRPPDCAVGRGRHQPSAVRRRRIGHGVGG